MFDDAHRLHCAADHLAGLLGAELGTCDDLAGLFGAVAGVLDGGGDLFQRGGRFLN